MELSTVPDFEKTLERFEAWWRCEIIDRPPVTIGVRPERRPTVPQKEHASLREKWFDMEYRIDRFETALPYLEYVGDMFPWFRPNLGPEIAATVFGCDLKFGESTSWSEPCLDSCRDVLKIEPDLENVYWQKMREGLEMSLERASGRWITALPPIIMHADLAAALRDPQNLCLDLATDLEGVRAACDHINRFYPLLFEDCWKRIEARGQLTTTWIPFLHARKANFTQCDFSCMISPEMFERAILPAIRGEMQYLERNIFHLDGPGALHHLDTLLVLEELDAVQWMYGAGQGPAAQWIEVYQRIQSAGKAVQLVSDDLADAKRVAEHLKPEGVWFCPGGGYSREEAEDFISWAARWAAKAK